MYYSLCIFTFVALEKLSESLRADYFLVCGATNSTEREKERAGTENKRERVGSEVA
jgi:hypothetical protein